MSVTKKIAEIKKDKEKNFISYFQSVTTIGVISKARNIKEASKKAQEKINQSNFACGIVNQTAMELSETEEWCGKSI